MNKYQTVLTKFIEDGHRLTHRERHQFGSILQELVDKKEKLKSILTEMKNKLDDMSCLLDDEDYCVIYFELTYWYKLLKEVLE